MAMPPPDIGKTDAPARKGARPVSAARVHPQEGGRFAFRQRYMTRSSRRLDRCIAGDHGAGSPRRARRGAGPHRRSICAVARGWPRILPSAEQFASISTFTVHAGGGLVELSQNAKHPRRLPDAAASAACAAGAGHMLRCLCTCPDAEGFRPDGPKAQLFIERKAVRGWRRAAADGLWQVQQGHHAGPSSCVQDLLPRMRPSTMIMLIVAVSMPKGVARAVAGDTTSPFVDAQPTPFDRLQRRGASPPP